MSMNVMAPGSNGDADHLRLLSIFHYVSAGLALCGVLFALGYFFMFQSLFSDPQLWKGSPQGPPPEQFLTMFRWFLGFIAVWSFTSTVLNFLSAMHIEGRRHRVFSMVVAGINCLNIPLGTILAVFTLVVLSRTSVRELYGA